MENFAPGSAEFLERLRCRAAEIAVNALSTRNMGRSGLIESGRSYLSDNLDFTAFKGIEAPKYGKFLDDLTCLMQKKVKPFIRRGNGWGPSRKLLNIFIRDAFYDHYLRPAYDLNRFESQLEIPLDGLVGRQLYRADSSLPKWGRVIDLTPTISSQFQSSAARIASQMNTFRVHLDIIYWRRDSALTSPPVSRK